MKTGLSLQELARKIEENAAAKRDFVAKTEAIEMLPGDDDVALVLNEEHALTMNDLAHTQLATYARIPADYYRRMRADSPELLSRNVNHWLHKSPDKRLVRTMNSTARAFLSDSYRPLENEELAGAVLPILLENRLEVMSCDITEHRLYIKAVDERITRDVPSGRKIGDGSHVFFDTCSPAIIISNSEVGSGALSVETGVFTKVCTNLATIAKDGMKRRHVGARHELTDNLQHLLSDDTKRATDKAIWLQVRDVVRGAFDEAKFEARTVQMGALATIPLNGEKAVETVKFTAKKFGLSEGEGNSILKHLIEGGDLTAYGLFNAVTRSAQDHEDYDRASDLETLGGKLLELPRGQWQELAKAA